MKARTGSRLPARPALRLLVLGILLATTGCNPFYVARAGWAQARILASREPLPEVMTDPATDTETQGKLRLVWDARRFAIDEMGFQNVGEAYTTFARLPSDTLALVLSAAHRDRLAFHTWWFPITGRVPYRAYFSPEGAERARQKMEAEGFDTYLRPTGAFSTLGWFNDPVYSTVLRQEPVGVVETILHELAHNHLFLPGQGRFNESYAAFVGHAAAIEFFCRGSDAGAETVRCTRARDRWSDARTVSRFLMELEAEIRDILDRSESSSEVKIERAAAAYSAAAERFRQRVQPSLQATSYAYLAREPLNNATLLARTLYFHRLDDFHRLWEEGWRGDLPGLLAWLHEEASRQADPFRVLDIGRLEEARPRTDPP